jgi:hypothetical protein
MYILRPHMAPIDAFMHLLVCILVPAAAEHTLLSIYSRGLLVHNS